MPRRSNVAWSIRSQNGDPASNPPMASSPHPAPSPASTTTSPVVALWCVAVIGLRALGAGLLAVTYKSFDPIGPACLPTRRVATAV